MVFFSILLTGFSVCMQLLTYALFLLISFKFDDVIIYNPSLWLATSNINNKSITFCGSTGCLKSRAIMHLLFYHEEQLYHSISCYGTTQAWWLLTADRNSSWELLHHRILAYYFQSIALHGLLFVSQVSWFLRFAWYNPSYNRMKQDITWNGRENMEKNKCPWKTGAPRKA